MFRDLIAQILQLYARPLTEPQEGSELERLLVEEDPDNAAARLRCKPAVDGDRLGFSVFSGGLQLDRAANAVAPDHELVAVPVDLRAEDLDIVDPLRQSARRRSPRKMCSSAFARVLEWVECTAQAISSSWSPIVWVFGVAESIDTLLCTIPGKPAS